MVVVHQAWKITLVTTIENTPDYPIYEKEYRIPIIETMGLSGAAKCGLNAWIFNAACCFNHFVRDDYKHLKYIASKSYVFHFDDAHTAIVHAQCQVLSRPSFICLHFNKYEMEFDDCKCN